MKAVAAVAILLLATLCCPVLAEETSDISVQEAAKLLKEEPDKLLVLDVRTPGEFREGHLPHARNMDFFGGSFDMDVKKLPKDATILLYCRTGRRSAGAKRILEAEGFKKVLHMDAGLAGWQKAGLPLKKD